MTDKLIEMAVKAGFRVEYTCNGKGRNYILGGSNELEAFANLIRADVREQCAIKLEAFAKECYDSNATMSDLECVAGEIRRGE